MSIFELLLGPFRFNNRIIVYPGELFSFRSFGGNLNKFTTTSKNFSFKVVDIAFFYYFANVQHSLFA